MRITRPYGWSDTDGKNRKLILRTDPSADPVDITDFTRQNPEILVAQWISMLDKIATKPNGQKSPTKAQRQFRDRLGKALWSVLKKDLIGQDIDHCKKLWESKTHPYPDRDFEPRKGKSLVKLKGSWYAVFCGEAEPEDVDCELVADKVWHHLYENQLRKGGDALPKQSGLITARAQSINANVLKRKPPPSLPDQKLTDYCKDGVDPVALIYQQIQQKQQKQGCSARDAHHISAEVLRAHYGRVFGKGCSLRKAEQDSSDLYSLHQQLKNTYRHLLKRSRKRPDTLIRILPTSLESLLAGSENITANKTLNDDIRLGKVIHYHLLDQADSDSLRNQPYADVRNERLYTDIWKAHISAVAASPFWHTKGQIRIKQTEAFIRVFRRSVTSMARTLRDMSNIPDDVHVQDVLDKKGRCTALDNFNNESFESRIELLFGKAAQDGLLGNAAENKDLFEYLLTKTGTLRNSIFHFKSMGHLQVEMTQSEGDTPSRINRFQAIWNKHQKASRSRKLAALKGVAVADYLTTPDLAQVIALLGQDVQAPLPLPRFNRLIKTAQNLNFALLLNKSDKINRSNLEEYPALRCQYVVLKMLYEHAFRRWLKDMPPPILNGHIKNSLNEATTRARKMNRKGPGGDVDIVISARAEKLIGARLFETLSEFLDVLSAETASEMRVQKGYDSDPENARKQAEFIEKLKCDVVARAFRDWLNSQNLNALRNIKKDAPPSGVQTDIDELAGREGDNPPADTDQPGWLYSFYILLYLMPVSVANALLHQLQKWQIVTSKDGGISDEGRKFADNLILAIGLYLDLHDDVHTGGTVALGRDGEVVSLFENEQAFNTVFPPTPDQARPEQGGHLLPIRGLREMLRFGHFTALKHCFASQKITSEQVATWHNQQTGIGKAQRRREELHEILCRPDGPNGNELAEYKDLTQRIAQHRHLTAQVTLTNHVRLHQLLAAVLARLVDFAGLWERDLYFITLAWIYHHDTTPEAVFEPEKLENLVDGRIVAALKNLCVEPPPSSENSPNDQTKFPYDKTKFPYDKTKFPYDKTKFPYDKTKFPNDQVKKEVGSIRNNFAHFNMLKPAAGSLDLTEQINKGRQLMGYDRKLKNAVSKSISDLLQREGIEITWKMTHEKQLHCPKMSSRCVKHLKGKGGTEPLHGDDFTAMVATLFNGEVGRPENCSGKDKRSHNPKNRSKTAQKRGRQHGTRS